jgi:hypothetical protein
LYTPGFVIDGREWRGFFQRQDLPKASAASGAAPNLKATVEGKGVAVNVEWNGSAPASASGWTVHLAELGFGLKTEIPRGENSGRTLINDFVALDHQTRALESGKTDAAFTFSKPKQEAAVPSHRAVAIWLTKTGQLHPVQAAGGEIGILIPIGSSSRQWKTTEQSQAQTLRANVNIKNPWLLMHFSKILWFGPRQIIEKLQIARRRILLPTRCRTGGIFRTRTSRLSASSMVAWKSPASVTACAS